MWARLVYTTFSIFLLFKQEVSFDSDRGGVSMKTHTGEMTTSYLLIENADIGDSGRYTCAPSNTGPASVKVHVFLHGKWLL